jgi:arylsulfatase A-like enzyme
MNLKVFSNRRFFPSILLLLIGLSTSSRAVEAADRPNVLIVVADDLGFSDLGCYGGEIATPNLDGLAKNGLRFTQFYNTARCWPSRAALLTGYYAQQVRRDTIPGIKSGAQGKRPTWAKLLPERLKPLGYRSYHSGKWHIDGQPIRNGFDHSYSLDDHDNHFEPRLQTEDGRALPSVKPGDGYYSSTAIADHAIKYLKDHAEHHGSQPFFSYIAFTAPHFPVQAPSEDVARYRSTYRAGWDALREDRFRRMKEMGIGGLSLAPIERDLGPPYAFPEAIKKLGPDEINRPVPWTTLSASQREFQAAKMAVHAAMVDRMDREIGRIIDQIREMKSLEDTLICFVSDNGASAEMMVRGDGHDLKAEPGSASTFLSIGPGWSSLANTPFRRHKTWVHEGGIATPLIVHWPSGIKGRGEIRQTPGHLIDIVPTILEAAGAKAPSKIEGQAVPPAPGKSLIPVFAKDGPIGRDSLWWLHEGNRALRVADWKIVASKDQPWELYNLGTDRSETVNLASSQLEKVMELAAIWTVKLEEFKAEAVEESAVERPPASKLPVKVFILAGQSNMEGQAVVDLEGKDYNDGKGTLKTLMRDPVKGTLFAHLKDAAGDWKTLDDVWVRYQPEDQPLRKGPLSVGFAVYNDRHHFGPELEFGHVMGEALENPVLIVKTAWGGKSLYRDFRPPSSGGKVGPYYSLMIEEVRESLANLAKDFPRFEGLGYELAGLVWYQGWNDGVDPRRAIPEYEQNLVNMIKDVRRDLKTPNLPVVIGELTGPWVKAPKEWERLRKAQANAANPPEFAGNVLFVETHDFVRNPADSPNPGHGHHEFGNAETYLLVGQALGNGMKTLLKSRPELKK